MDMILLFIIQIGTLIYCVRKKVKWGWVAQLAFQLVCTLYAGSLLRYYENLPLPEGSKAPGLAYFSEQLTYFTAKGAFLALLCVAAVLAVARWSKAEPKIRKTEQGRPPAMEE